MTNVYENWNLPGIYMFINKINGKGYIGRSFGIRKRILHHLRNFYKERYISPLYTAFKKYGIDNFEVILLKSFDKNIEKVSLSDSLDKYEKLFIDKFKTYGEYNQTNGGDAGILGYVFTKELKNRVSVASKLRSNLFYKKVYGYDYLSKCTYMAISIKHMATITNVKRSVISKIANGHTLSNKNFTFAFTKELLHVNLRLYITIKDPLLTGNITYNVTEILRKRMSDAKKQWHKNNKVIKTKETLEKLSKSLSKYKVKQFLNS